MVMNERRLSTIASRTMAAMSLGFIVMVTPWTIQEVLPPGMDFTITWLALSNSFWNPFLYWLLNSNFRRISRELILTKVLGRELRKHPPHSTPHLPHVCCPSGLPSTSRPDIEGEGPSSEKYWGDILERTVSSNSLQALQRVYPPPHHSMTLPHQYSMSMPPRHSMTLPSPPDYPRVHQPHCAVPGH
ncbi:hypothetical protein M8J75_012046 [Diaphorina citri]|nr:hypothetical protein M8J75_012046 [Diaphorina citri]